MLLYASFTKSRYAPERQMDDKPLRTNLHSDLGLKLCDDSC